MDTSLAISIVGLIVAFFALYFSHLQSAQFEVLYEGEIHIYYPENGGVAFFVPMIFLNNSRNSGSVLSVVGRLRDENKNTDYYIKWRTESSIDFDSGKYKHIDKAVPFYVAGKSSSHKVLWFYIDTEEHVFSEGTFGLTVYGWNNRVSQPSFETVKYFKISSELANMMNARKQTKDATTRILKFNDSSPGFIRVQSNNNHDWTDNYFGP